MEWSESQLDIINHRGSAMLVSAAAGSGKTAVLVERIIKRVCDGENPEDIDRFVIVTFTRAAASEVRTKISREFALRLSRDPGNRHLHRQMSLLGRARISTVHSFCQNIVRSGGHVLNISPDIRLIDEKESEVMAGTVLDGFIESLYERGDGRDFIDFVESFSGERDDLKVKKIIAELYKFIQSGANPEQKLEYFARMYSENADFEKSEWLREIKQNYGMMLRYYLAAFINARTELENDYALAEYYAAGIDADIELIKTILQNFESCYDKLAAIASERPAPLKTVYKSKISDIELKERIHELHKAFKEKQEEFAEDIFAYPAKTHINDTSYLSKAVNDLCRLTNEYGRLFAQEKNRLSVVDFNDLEHFAKALLTDKVNPETGEITPSDFAFDIQEGITELLVDEYQDTNEIQDIIFRSLTDRKDNLFMVGDVKQSIYRFRMADPSIFLAKYTAFRKNMGGKGFILTNNYRSRRDVIDSVNAIFDKIMSVGVGDIEYDENERLNYAAAYPEAASPVEIDIIDLKARTENDEDDNQDETAAEIEAAHIAARIKNMLDTGYMLYDRKTGATRRAEPSDFVILLRSVKNRAAGYKNALSDAGIPAFCEQSGGLLGTPEVSVILAYLYIIDNPYQDVPLIAVLRSPLFCFSADDLVSLRLEKRDCVLFDALKLLAAGANAKATEFCAKLEYYRSLCADMTAGELIQRIYDDTGMLTLYGAKHGGAARKANLSAFCETARSFEKNNYKGLYSFLSHIRALIESGGDIDAAAPSAGNAGAVRIMSMHKSKGLEFPVVFIANCTKGINTQDLRNAVLTDAELGIGVKRRDTELGIQYTTLAREAIAMKKFREMQSEEMRLLYVAMTRAEEKLIFVSCIKNLSSKIKKIADVTTSGKVDPYNVISQKSYSDWLLSALLSSDARGELCGYIGENKKISASGMPEVMLYANADDKEEVETLKQAAADGIEATTANPKTVERIIRRISYKYPYAKASAAPSKLTATQYKGRFYDDEVKDGQPRVKYASELKRPAFTGEVVQMNAAQKGIALHGAMQYINFRDCGDENAVERQLQLMLEAKQLDKAQYACIDRKKIVVFAKSEIAKRMNIAQSCEREYKFSVLAPAGSYINGMTEDIYAGEKILLQGVIDCFFIENGKLVIIDFKTDKIRGDSIKEKAREYAPQLKAYTSALCEIYGISEAEAWLYFFDVDTPVKVNAITGEAEA